MKKGLGFIDVFCIASGAMISSGIFVLPGLAFAQIGPAMIISYFIAGLLALIGVFSVIELATAMPKAGGDYYFLTRSLGPLVGTVAGLLACGVDQRDGRLHGDFQQAVDRFGIVMELVTVTLAELLEARRIMPVPTA